MNDAQLYLESAKEVVGLTQKGDWYSLVRAAGIIRQWFFDGGNSLVDKVNRQFGHKLLFTVTKIPIQPGNMKPILAWRNPEAPPTWKTEELKRDPFFAFVCIRALDTDITIHQVIMYCANVAGGVHAGTPKTEEEKLLAEIDQFVRIGGVQAAAAIRGIIQVILTALEPLTASAMYEVYLPQAKALLERALKGHPNAQQLLDQAIAACNHALMAKPNDPDATAILEKATAAKNG